MLIILWLFLAAIAWRVLSRLWIHPLRQYPGPKLAAISNLPYLYQTLSGNSHAWIRELHDEYGSVVRIRPNALTYRTFEAWTDIYGHRKQGALPFCKDPEFFTPAPSGQTHMINANEADHTRQKKLLTHAFSEKSLREQESLVMSYIDLFIRQLQTSANAKQPLNLEEWLNFLTFDIIGDLAFGEPFGCLEESEYHPWVATIFKSIKTGAFLRAFSIYPLFVLLIRKAMPKRLIQKRLAHYQMSKDKVTKRLQTNTTRPDFTSYILKHNDDEKGMLRQEMDLNAAIIIQAGSETTATVLAAAVFYLQKHPEWQKKLTEEVRGAFPTDESITFLASSKLPILNAVIEESLRLFPPAPAIGPRVVPQGGAQIDGKHVAEGVSVSVAHYSAFRAHSNFTQPDSFLPERWIDYKDPSNPFHSDRREALQPFSYGPRACIGRNLAYAEMRTILAKLLWHFDVSLEQESEQWDQCKSYIVWEKGPLFVKLESVPSTEKKKA
ncbi:uncharacterized protein N7529_008591 [Penicillium soppii]|uniref:uncharacterized protein n=1 Tax=Penicillium soppii TaxID=69789 RepID=UPI0025477AD4|nr:uncharacterized protein N7529_008591 [Penicillium soppii]KAJ5861281.1 hypothetical protein N7529_008591 [Penicillium soppii]